MGYLELDLSLSDEDQAIRDLSRQFAAEVIRPAGIELDRLADPADVIGEKSLFWDLLREFRELDFHRVALPKAVGGMAEDYSPLARVIMMEELSHGDVGVTASLFVSNFTFGFAALCEDPAIRAWAREYCEDTEGRVVGCWAITEPDHGSDWWFGAEAASADGKCAPSLRAVRKGDEYVLNGQKSAWVSNGTIATHALLNVSLDPKRGMQGTGVAVLPLDLLGISRGKPLDKMGMRALNQGEIIFEDVKIPRKYMVVEDPSMASVVIATTLNHGNMGVGMAFTGLAQAALDEAVAYAKDRVQVASEAVQIFGGIGLSKESLIEKLFRDARAGTIADGDNEALALVGARYL